MCSVPIKNSWTEDFLQQDHWMVPRTQQQASFDIIAQDAL